MTNISCTCFQVNMAQDKSGTMDLKFETVGNNTAAVVFYCI